MKRTASISIVMGSFIAGLAIFAASYSSARWTRGRDSRIGQPTADSLTAFRHVKEGVVDVEIVIEWNYAGKNRGRESYLLKRCPAIERGGTAQQGINWDGATGGGGWTTSLDIAKDKWIFTVESYWIIDGAEEHFEKRFQITPFTTTTFDEGEFHAVISYNGKKEALEPTR